MTPMHAGITILLVVIGTMITRFLPFICFPSEERTPKYIVYLGKVLPYAVMGFLVMYCLKGVSVVSYPYGIPELISILCIVILHLWRKNTILSIAAGTAIYMILIQAVFQI